MPRYTVVTGYTIAKTVDGLHGPENVVSNHRTLAGAIRKVLGAAKASPCVCGRGHTLGCFTVVDREATEYEAIEVSEFLSESEAAHLGGFRHPRLSMAPPSSVGAERVRLSEDGGAL